MNAAPPPERDEPSPGIGAFAPLYQLVYCSRAAADVDEAAVDRIIESSHRRNPARAVTGLLVFGSGIFFQWIEGPREQVTRLMAIIEADPRHQQVVTLSESEEVRERLFPEWDMERVSTDDIRGVLLDALDTAEDPKNAGALTRMLEQLDTGQLSGLASD
jgi:hypothetical protein